MKLLIAVPVFDNIMQPETFKAIYDVERPEVVDEIDFDFVRGYSCDVARNDICKRAIEEEYDWVLMVDSDVIIPKDTLKQFFRWWPGMPPLSLGLVPKKNTTTGQTDMFSFASDNFCEANRYSYGELERLETLKHAPKAIGIKGGAFGCALVDVNLLKKLDYPWFQYVQYSDGGKLSEDLYFCTKVNEHFNSPTEGSSICLNLKVRCGHLVRTFQYK